MREFLQKLAIALLCTLTIFPALAAEKIEFRVDVPLTVAAGTPFQAVFVLNAKPEKGSFKAPSFEGFEVLAGPAENKFTQWAIINGKQTSSVSHQYTYVLLAHEAGTVTLGAAEIEVDGKRYRTAPQPIEVVDESDARQQQSTPQQGSATQQRGASDDLQSRIAEDDILLRAIVSRTSVFKNEPLRVTFKLYVRINVAGYENVKFPSFNGFWAQELTADNGRQGRETFNGKVYETLVAREFLLYPQQAGTLTIEPAELTAIAQVIVQNRNIDPFFGGGRDIYNVPRKVQSPRINITVKSLPAGAPASFSGAVGSFEMEATQPAKRLAANSGATYGIKISGTGNLTFVQAPKLNLPGSFEQYNVKTTESINASASGISGYRQFEYPFIARAEGSYEIEPVEFSYFDPAKGTYVTLSSKPLALEIDPDERSGGGEAVVLSGRGMSKEEVRMLGQDIRFIKLGAPQLRAAGSPLFLSVRYWVLLVVLLASFGGAYAALRRRIRESHNLALVRGKRANKVAVQRFRTARKYMESDERHAFYEEMLRALWGYMGDKFNIPVANLTKENVREELAKRGVAAEESQRFTAIITQCEEAQYSPSATAQLANVYAEGVDLISRIESVIKR